MDRPPPAAPAMLVFAIGAGFSPSRTLRPWREAFHHTSDITHHPSYILSPPLVNPAEHSGVRPDRCSIRLRSPLFPPVRIPRFAPITQRTRRVEDPPYRPQAAGSRTT